MNKLDELQRAYIEMNKIRTESTIQYGKFILGPNSKGGVYLLIDGNTILNDISIQEIKDLRETVNYFYNKVLGEMKND